MKIGKRGQEISQRGQASKSVRTGVHVKKGKEAERRRGKRTKCSEIPSRLNVV